MGLEKTSYNLIYNTDGSLCTTIREDDVPFEGVKSFAVEEGTTNHADGSKYTNAGASVPDTNGKFTPVYTGYRLTTDDWKPLYYHSGMALALNDGESIAISAWIYIDDDYGAINTQIDSDLRYNRSLTWYYNLSRGWHYLTWSYTNNNGQTETINTVRIETNRASSWASDQVSAYIANVQIEQKPFATSFVDGTRQDGRFYIPLEKIPFDVVNDDWIIAYWKKPIATHDNTLTGYNLFSLGRYTSDNSKGYIWWGKASSSNIFRIEVVYNDATTDSADSSTFDPNWYFNNWHFEVLRKADEVIDYFVDGIKQCSLALTTNLQTFVEGLTVGGNFDDPDNNSLIASLAFGYAKDDLGNLVWTDEYIQELYNARKPFSVPPRIPIL